MIDLIIQILGADHFYGVSKNIDIAKGVNKTSTNFNDAWQQRKRIKAWQKQQK